VGILITHHNKKGWRISVREAWYVDSKRSLEDIGVFLKRHGFAFMTAVAHDDIVLSMNNAECWFKEFPAMMEVLCVLFDFKQRYGLSGHISLDNKNRKKVI